MSEKIYPHIHCVILDKDCTIDAVDEPITGNICSCDSADMQETMNTVLSQQKNQRVLVITNSILFCKLLLTLNETFSRNKISVLCQGKLNDADAIEEIRRAAQMLHTETGTEFFPKEQIAAALYQDEKGNLLLKDAAIGDTVLYAADGSAWGCKLDSACYSAQRLIGALAEHTEEFGLRTKAVIVRQILDLFDANALSSIDQMLIFHSDTGIQLLCTGAPQAYDMESILSLIYTVYFSHNPDSISDKLGMLVKDQLENKEYPAFLFEDFVAAFSGSVFPNREVAPPSEALLRNTIERILLLEVN